jgi:hypothetical protein
MKHYIGKITERSGDMEYSDKYLFTTKGSPDRYAKKVAMEWRGCTKADWDARHDGWWCDDTLIFNDGAREIPKEDYEVLRKYLAVL